MRERHGIKKPITVLLMALENAENTVSTHYCPISTERESSPSKKSIKPVQTKRLGQTSVNTSSRGGRAASDDRRGGRGVPHFRSVFRDPSVPYGRQGREVRGGWTPQPT